MRCEAERFAAVGSSPHLSVRCRRGAGPDTAGGASEDASFDRRSVSGRARGELARRRLRSRYVCQGQDAQEAVRTGNVRDIGVARPVVRVRLVEGVPLSDQMRLEQRDG